MTLHEVAKRLEDIAAIPLAVDPVKTSADGMHARVLHAVWLLLLDIERYLLKTEGKI